MDTPAVPTYACVATDTPWNWPLLRVLDAEGNEVKGIIEVNTEEGWAVRYVERRPPGEEEWPTERIEGTFRLAWAPAD